MRLGGIILAGGASRRMGRPKACLPFGPQTMLQRVVDRLIQAADPVIVVAAPLHDLPPLPCAVRVVADDWPGQGPLTALVTGLRAMDTRAEAAYVCGCDVPLLAPAFVRALVEQLGEAAIGVPVHGREHEPLAAVYRLSVLPTAEQLVQAGVRTIIDLYDLVPTCRIPVEDLRRADPQLGSLLNVNTPADYALALRLAFG